MTKGGEVRQEKLWLQNYCSIIWQVIPRYPDSTGMTIGTKYAGSCALADVKIHSIFEVNRTCGDLFPGL